MVKETSMGNSHDKAKEFEKLTAQVCETLHPEATVEINQKIPGVFSQTKRQIDVLITTGTTSTVVECKDYNKPLDVKVIESVIGEMNDIRAQRCMIVSANGYTTSALQRLKNDPNTQHIEPCRLIDTGDHAWKSTVSLPSICFVKSLASIQFSIEYLDFICGIPVNHSETLYDANMKEISEKIDLLLTWWVIENKSVSIGYHENITFINDPIYFLIQDKLLSVKITANILVEEIIYFRKWPLSEISGFQNQINQEITTRGITTGNLTLAELKNNWTKIDRIDDLEKKPIITIHISTW